MASQRPKVKLIVCVRCRREVWAADMKGRSNATQTCGSLVCGTVTWTDEEWQARAKLAANRPPWRRGQRLPYPSQVYCNCTPEPTGDVTVVLRVEPTGAALLCRCCPHCERLTAQLWWDDPHTAGGGDPSRWIDFEALRRFPDGGYRPDWSLSLPPTEGLVIIPPRSVDHEPTPDEPAATEPPEPPVPTEPEIEVPEPTIPEPEIEVPAEPDEPPAVTPSEPVDLSSALLSPELPAEAPIPVPARLPARSGPPVCLVVDLKAGEWTAKCGRVVKTSDTVKSLPAAQLTGWGSHVTCPACLTAMMRRAAAA